MTSPQYCGIIIYRKGESECDTVNLKRNFEKPDAKKKKKKNHDGGRHEIWINPKGKTFPVGRHDNEEVKNGTLQNILKQAGLK